MKKQTTLTTIALFMASLLYAQPSPTTIPEGFTTGEVTLADNTVVTGAIKDNIRKKGEVVLLTGTKKTKYKAGDINGARIGKSHYIAQNYTFYEVLLQGNSVTLLRKANEPSGVQTNGPDAVIVNSEGSIDDLFIKKIGETSLQILTKKNVKDVLGKLCGDCASSVEPGKFDAESVKKLLSGL